MKVYMSGIEGNEDNIMKLLDAGYPIKYLMASYLSLRKRQDSIEKIIKLRKQYGVHLILDSGAHAVVYEENAKKEKGKDSWHAINKDVAAIKDDPDTYVDSYIEFLEKNREMYDIAVEFDIQGTVGDEKVNEWREKFLSKGLPILFVMHLKTGDVQEFVDKWHEKGLQYIGFGGANGMEDKVKAITKHAQDLGMWVHWFGYTPLDLFRRSNADSVDSTSWLAAPKLAEVYTHRGKQLTSWNIKDNPIKFKAILKDDVFKVFDQKDFERRLSEKKYYYISYYSLKEFALWNEENSKTANVKKYETQLELSKTGEIQLPTWAQDFDKMGRPKAIYLNARYNATKHAVTAKGLHQNALVCHNCAINDRCPVASTDPNNDLCLDGEVFIAGDNKDIMDYNVGDRLFARDGYADVEGVSERDYDGDMYEIKASGILSFKATPSHPLYVVRRRGSNNKVTFIEEGWKEVKDLISGNLYSVSGRDYLVIPRLKGLYDNVTLGGYTVDKDLAWALGLYIAEGSTYINYKKSYYNGCIYLNKNEIELAERFRNVLKGIGIKTFVRNSKTALVVYFHGKKFIEMLSSFGKKAWLKEIPEEILLVKDSSILESLLKGYEEGDGCIYGNNISMSTVSKKLAYQVQLANARLGRFVYISKMHDKGEGVIEGRIVNIHTAYNVVYSNSDSKTKRHVLEEDRILVPIISKKKFTFTGKVYNLQTSKSEYLANNIISHNCYFIPYWKSLGEKTRNREQLRKTLEEIVANDIVRLNYQQYQEAQLGQGIDKSTLSLQNLILKELELLARFNGGSNNIIMNVDKQQINFGNIDEELNSVRQEYGEEFASKIKKKLESEDGSNEY